MRSRIVRSLQASVFISLTLAELVLDNVHVQLSSSRLHPPLASTAPSRTHRRAVVQLMSDNKNVLLLYDRHTQPYNPWPIWLWLSIPGQLGSRVTRAGYTYRNSSSKIRFETETGNKQTDGCYRFLARDVIYASRAYATMSVSVCPPVCDGSALAHYS